MTQPAPDYAITSELRNRWIEKELGPPPNWLSVVPCDPAGDRVYMACIDSQHGDCPATVRNTKCLCKCHDL
jgi:hypothetical protein